MKHITNYNLFRKAKTKTGDYMFILNSKDFQQEIQIESCIGILTVITLMYF